MTPASEKILFIPPKTVSGAAQSLAAAREIRRAHRKAKITCLTTPALAPLFAASPYFNTIDPDADPADWKQALAVVKRLRNAGFDGGYDFRGSPMTQKLRQSLKPRPSFWSSPAAALADEDAPDPVGAAHPLERMERQLITAGVLEGPAGLLPDLSWLATVGRNTRTLEPAYFGLTDHYAILLPCTAAREKAPAFKPEEWAALAAALLEQGLRPVTLGSVADRPVANAVRAAAPQAKEFLGRANLLQMASLCRNSRLVVTALAPAAHLAAAASAEIITVFAAGDPDPRIAAPRGQGSSIALTPSSTRVSAGDVIQSARALGAFRRQSHRVA
jgi:ADP-heptose:LPS heptosyltransferase